MKIFRVIALAAAAAAIAACAKNVFDFAGARDSRVTAERLLAAVDGLSATGLPAPAADTQPLKDAMASGDGAAIDRAARDLFMTAAAKIDTGAVDPADRESWRMPRREADLAALNAAADNAFRTRNFAAAFASAAPDHAQYHRLETALATARDPGSRAVIALNMERWRWMPRDLGEAYVLVNAPAYELMLYRNGRMVDRRRVVIGTTKLPTPQIAVTATAIAFNPTWFVPKSIVAESVGALMKDNPARAEALGYYVAADGGVRQKPGPANALGRMKVVMPNPWSVFLHDTPGKDAFKRDMRALSHGCIRVDDALSFAKLLIGTAATSEEISEILVSGEPREVALEKALPVYIGYFTAFVEDDGAVKFYKDVYGLDAPLLPRFGGGETAKDDAIGSLIIESCPELGDEAPKDVKDLKPRGEE